MYYNPALSYPDNEHKVAPKKEEMKNLKIFTRKTPSGYTVFSPNAVLLHQVMNAVWKKGVR